MGATGDRRGNRRAAVPRALVLVAAALFAVAAGAVPALAQEGDALVDGDYDVTDRDIDSGPDGQFAAANSPLTSSFTASGCTESGCQIDFSRGDYTGSVRTMTVRGGGGTYTGTWKGDGCTMDVTMTVSGGTVTGKSVARCGAGPATGTWSAPVPDAPDEEPSGSTSGDDLEGTWDVSYKTTSYEETGLGAIDSTVDRPEFEKSLTFRCDGGTCTSTPAVYGDLATTELTGEGDEWSGTGAFKEDEPCQSTNQIEVSLTVDGDRFTGEVTSVYGYSSAVDQAGNCSDPSGAFEVHEELDLVGTRTGGGSGGSSEEEPGSSGGGGPSGGSGGGSGSGSSSGTTEVDAGLDPLSERQEESVAAIDRGDRSTVPAALQAPSEAFGDLGHTIGNALLAGAVVLLLVFPAELFNSTFDEHQDRIRAGMRRFGRGGNGGGLPSGGAAEPDGEIAGVGAVASDPGPADDDAPAAPGRMGRGVLVFALVALAGAVLGGFLDPNFGVDGRSAALVVGVLVTIVIGTLLSGLVGRTFRAARHHGTSATLRAVPLGLLVAAGCVLVSRLTHFQPGYLYGLVGGLAFASALDRREGGQLELVAVGAGILVAMLAWFASVPVGAAANDGDPGFFLQVADSVTGSLFIGTIEGLLFGLIPLRTLPGSRITEWSRAAWALAAFAVAFTFVQVLLRPSTGYLGESSSASVAVTMGLFLAFGLGSMAFWAWFRFRPDPAAPAEATA